MLQFSGIQAFTLLDYPEHTSCVLFLPGCNMRCKFCHNAEFVLPEKIKQIKDSFIDESVIFSFLEKRKGKLDGIVISGGEPTVHVKLPQFIKKVKNMGFLVKLDTNGNKPEMLVNLYEQGLLDYVAMDIKSDMKTYQALVGKRAKPELIQESMEIIRKSGIQYEFRSTLVREFHTPEVLEAMTLLFKECDILYLQQFRSGNTLDPAYKTRTGYYKEEMEDFAKKYFSHVKKVIVRS